MMEVVVTSGVLKQQVLKIYSSNFLAQTLVHYGANKVHGLYKPWKNLEFIWQKKSLERS